MTIRQASCSCGQLNLSSDGDPLRVSICHCLACQRRTGSAFGIQARFSRRQITAIHGESKCYTRVGDSGGTVDFYFCPVCGATLYWELSGLPDVIAVPVGAFADPHFPPPQISIYEARRHGWIALSPDIPVEHFD